MLRMKKDMVNKEKYFERFLVLFDAIVAIVITIIVLTIKVPSDIKKVDTEFLLSIFTTISFYAISFYIVATYWEMHHRIIEAIIGSSRKFVGYNFAFLFILSLFPIACIFMNDASTMKIDGLNQFAFVFYMIVNLFASVMQVRIMRYIQTHPSELIFDQEAMDELDVNHGKQYYSHVKLKMALNVLPLITAFFFPAFAFLAYIVVAVIVSLSLRRVNKGE